MAPLSVLLALMLAHPGTSIISGTQSDKQVARQDKETQSRRVGVGLAVAPGRVSAAAAAEESREDHDLKEGRTEQKRGGLSGQASHLHGNVYGGHEGFGGHNGAGFEGFGGHHYQHHGGGGGGLGFYGGGGGGGGYGAGGYGGSDLGGGGGGGLDGGIGHIDYDHHQLGHHHDPHLHKALAFKSLLVPLAGVALLGAAAAFVTNPILLQLGVISGRRRRRGAVTAEEEQLAQLSQLAKQRVGDLQLLENFMAQIPRAEARAQEQRLLASYLTCTGIVPSAANDTTAAREDASCLERLSCELHQDDTSGASALERHVMRVVTGEILSNEYIPESVKKSVQKAVLRGKHGDDCAKYYPCEDLDDK